jgi:hypothetical protein
MNKALYDESEKYGRTIALLEALSEKSVRTSTYSEAAKTGLQQASNSQKITASPGQKERSPTDTVRKDERAVRIDTGRTKAEKTDFVIVKERLQSGLDKAKVIEGLKIEFLRPSPGERIEVVFKDRPHTGVGWGQKIYSHSRRIMEWGPRRNSGVLSGVYLVSMPGRHLVGI